MSFVNGHEAVGELSSRVNLGAVQEDTELLSGHLQGDFARCEVSNWYDVVFHVASPRVGHLNRGDGQRPFGRARDQHRRDYLTIDDDAGRPHCLLSHFPNLLIAVVADWEIACERFIRAEYRRDDQ